jgi:hypothetical protein
MLNFRAYRSRNHSISRHLVGNSLLSTKVASLRQTRITANYNKTSEKANGVIRRDDNSPLVVVARPLIYIIDVYQEGGCHHG